MTRMTLLLVPTLLLGGALLPTPLLQAKKPVPAAATQSPEQAARQAAEAWLKLLDAEDYRASWSSAAPLFQQAVSVEQWQQAARAARRPLGAVQSRQLLKATHATALPGAPDGEYVVIQFATRFAHKQAAVETITPMRQADGSWRVSGYYVK